MNCLCSIISIGPGWMPWMIMAAIKTADGAEPGMPSASAGMIWPGIQDMSPGSAQRRDQRDAAGKLAPAEGESIVGVEPFLADLRHEQAERAHQPSLERVVADDAAGHRDAQ